MTPQPAPAEDAAARRARVDREDIAAFVTSGFACTGQAEYYAERGEQAVSIAFLHDYVRGNHRRLYALCLAAGLNDFSRAMIVHGLLAAGSPDDAAARAAEGELIAAALAELPPPRVYKLFRRLRASRINNRRARATVRTWLAGRDLAFDALKYRSGLKAATRHTHLAPPGEIGRILYRAAADRRGEAPFDNPLLETWRQAHYDKRKIFDLPMTVAEGLAAHHGMKRKQFLEGIEQRMTRRERERIEASARAAGAELERLDLARMDLTRLVLFGLSRPPEERPDFAAPMAAAAARIAARLPRLGSIAAVVDRSRSTRGSREKRDRPLAVGLAVEQALRAAAARHGDRYSAHWTTPPLSEDHVPLGVAPFGQTDLARPLIVALAGRPDAVFIISDGYENVGPGSADEVVRVARSRLGATAPVIHLNPVFDPETYSPRALGPHITTVGVRTADDLPLALRLARFVDGADDLAAFTAWLDARARRMIDRWREKRADR